jgi:cytochrome P450
MTTAQRPVYPMQRGTCPFDPPRQLARIQAECPITRVTLWDGTEPWLVTRHEDLRALMSDSRVSANTLHPNFPHMGEGMKARQHRAPTFINMDDPGHAEQRRKVTADFSIRRIETLRPKVQGIVDGLIDDMLAGPRPADLVAALALPVPSLVICELLGVPYADRATFHELSATVNSVQVTAAESTAAMEGLLGYLGELVDGKAAEGTDDLLGRLISGHMVAGDLSRDDIVKIARLLLVAGHDTTANMIALGTAVLLEHPDELARLQGDPSPETVRNAVEELLRYLTVSHFGRRRVAADDIDHGGRLIRRGEGLIFAADIANRDPDAFPDPDRLDLTRPARHHVAFGFGVHQCLGQSLARLELEVVFGALFRRIPTLALVGEASDLRYKSDLAVYGVYELPVTW